MGKQPAPICPTCGQPAKLSDGKFGMKAECCGLWSWGGKMLVSRETHAARIQAHEVFDALWKSGRLARRTAYARLADVMGIAPADCHISLMDAGDAHKIERLVKAGKLDQDTRGPPIVEDGPRDRARKRAREIYITVGADCPWNTTSGVRQSWIFRNVAEAHHAGFVSVT